MTCGAVERAAMTFIVAIGAVANGAMLRCISE